MTLECKHLIIAATAVVLSAVGLAKAQTTAPVHLPRTPARRVTRGLVLHYSFESLSRGLVLDASGKGHHGKAVHASLTKEGKIGAAAAFDGSRSYIDLGVNHDLPARDAYTISVWFLNDGKGHRSNGYGQKIFDKTVMYHDFYLCLKWRTGQVCFQTY